LLANQLSEGEEQALENHVVSCEACRQQLDKLTQFAQSVHTFGASPIGNGQGQPQSAGVLARLANSSRPALRRAEQSSPEKKQSSKSRTSRFGGSTTIRTSGRFLRRQFWTWPLIAALVLGGTGWWVSQSVENAMRRQRIHDLKTVLEADVAALRGWMDNQRATAELVAADEQLRPIASELLALADSTPEARSRLIRSPAQAAIRSRLDEPLRRGGFSGFLLVSPAGIAVAVDDDAPVGAALAGYRSEFFARVCGGQAAVSKPFLSPFLLADERGELRADLPCMYAAAPILDERRQPIAALGLRLRPDGKFSEILRVARSGSTGETYAFDRGGMLLSQSRFDEMLKRIGLLVDREGSRSILNVELRDPGANMVAGERPVQRRGDQPLTRMARSAVLGEGGFDGDGYRDYRGVPVVGAWKWLDEYGLGVATEIDVDEAFAPVYILRRAFLVLMSLLVASAAVLFAVMLWASRKHRALQDASLTAQQVGQYTLVEKLGRGGMGTVYKARHALLRRPTAIKLLNPELISDTGIARFEREVQLTSGLTHPNTVAIYDYGRTPEGVFYYAMEYLEGVNLDELVHRYGAVSEARAVYILRQVCASLAEAHAAGLVHRDVKPANILLTVRGGQHDFVKVLDFGLAKLTEGQEANLTSTNTVAGTPLYVSPEAITHPEQIDARADVYAIGAVGYFLLAGTPVFSGASAADICLMHVQTAPQPPSVRAGRPVSPALEALLLRCLAKSPADRPANAAELLQLLETCPETDRWTAAAAAQWWADRTDEHSAATAHSASLQRSALVAAGRKAPA
jgi:hypothetical protein